MTKAASRNTETSKTPKADANKVLAELRAVADGDIATHAQRFFKTGPGEYAAGDCFLGLRVPTVRALVKRYRHLSLDETVKLLSSRFHEARLFALLMLVEQYKTADEQGRTRIFHHYLDKLEQINNWDLVDCSAPAVVGAYLTDKDRALLYQLAGSENLWRRRIAIMATFFMIKRNDFEDALAIAALLRNDPHDLIHKATGWMLREIGKRDYAAEKRFLDKYYRGMPRTMLRYAIERVPEKQRQAYLRGTA